MECGGAEFNNMYKDCNVEAQPEIDFVAHAAAMGAHAEKAADIAELEATIVAARGRDVPSVIVIDTDAVPGTGAGGHWWDVAVPRSAAPSGWRRPASATTPTPACSASSTDRCRLDRLPEARARDRLKISTRRRLE